MHFVTVLATHGVVPFDLAIPCERFGRGARTEEGTALYEMLVCGEEPVQGSIARALAATSAALQARPRGKR